jgi:plasmid stabilization system protein ParE
VKIYVTESAYSDLEAIEKYYSDEGVPHVGKQFIANIIEHIQTLAQNPEIGRQVPEFEEKRIRELIHPPFRIVYMKEQSSIHVVRVWRSERLLKLPEDET